MRVERLDAISPIGAEWDALAERESAPPWMRPGWFERWLDAFRPASFEILCCREGDDLLGVLPLTVSGRTLRGASNPESPAFGMLTGSSAAARALGQHVLYRGPSRFEFRYLTAYDPDVAALREAAADSGYLISERTVARSPFTSTIGGWDGFVEARGTAQFREERRKRRMLEKEGDLRFEVDDGGNHLDLLLNQALAIEDSGWKGRAHTAIAERTDVLAFYRSIVHWGAERGWLRFMFLRLDGQGIAFDLTFVEKNVCYLLKTSYEDAMSRWSPGRVLRQAAIRWACDGDVERYEFLGTDDSFKRKWADGYRDRLLMRGFAARPLGHIEHAAYREFGTLRRRYLGPLKRKLMSHSLARKVFHRH
jgi:CelD/BcsL family acetyltransferase involved in cellulose biosynthesis